MVVGTWSAAGELFAQTTTFDGSSASNGAVTTTYSANQVTVTDQAGKTRRSITDGLGRMTRVDEADSTGSLGTVASPTQPTSYVYDVLDDLVKVTQGGQSRYFAYDSLKRLLRARNPEQDINTNLSPALTDPVTNNSQWCVKYDYDLDSNLSQKTDTRNITTNYNYDFLNRITSRAYTNDPQSTPAVNYFYDGQTVPTLPTGAPTFTRGSSTGRLIAAIYGTSNTGTYQGYDRNRIAKEKPSKEAQGRPRWITIYDQDGKIAKAFIVWDKLYDLERPEIEDKTSESPPGTLPPIREQASFS